MALIAFFYEALLLLSASSKNEKPAQRDERFIRDTGGTWPLVNDEPTHNPTDNSGVDLGVAHADPSPRTAQLISRTPTAKSQCTDKQGAN